MTEATDMMSKAAMDRTARWLAETVEVNSGALVQIDLDLEVGFVAEVSASTHVYPRHPYSAEAPRVYGDDPVTIALWRRWVEGVVEAELVQREQDPEYY
jgi:hypothetical protein